MRVDYGRVKSYNIERGFGFFESLVFGGDVFFHIKTVKDPATVQALKFPPSPNRYNLEWLVLIETTQKGLAVSAINPVLDRIPATDLNDFLKTLCANLGRDRIRHLAKLLRRLLEWPGLSDEYAQQFLNSPIARQAPHSLLPLEHPERKLLLAKSLELERLWANVRNPDPSWLESITQALLGETELRRLQQLRNDLLAQEAIRREAELAERKAQELAAAQRRLEMLREEEAARQKAEALQRENEARSLRALIETYRLKPKGVRDVKDLQETCLECGAQRTKTPPKPSMMNIECCECGNSWYISNCWSCGSARVDSRDPETPKCEVCGWQKCAKCQSCHWHGCRTNPYHKNNLYKNALPKQKAPPSQEDTLAEADAYFARLDGHR